LELLNSILRSTDFCVFSAMTLHIKATVERWPVEGHFTIARGAMHLLLEFHDLVHCHGNLGMMHISPQFCSTRRPSAGWGLSRLSA
jgi:hypothetical protein